MKNKKAFTLIELLVVISIIALLMSILMPGLGKAREQARMLVCSSNQKTLVMGATLWSEANKGFAIAGDWWKEVGDNERESSITPYIESSRKKKNDSLSCPTARNIKFYSVNGAYNTSGQEFTFNYASNGYLTYNIGDVSPGIISGPKSTDRNSGGFYGPNSEYWTVRGATKMTSVRSPHRIAYFIDHEYYAAVSWTFDPTVPVKDFPIAWQFQTRWHQKKPSAEYGKGIIGWVDGHVTKEPDDLGEKYTEGGATKKRWTYYFIGK